jgi:hypothetical protein
MKMENHSVHLTEDFGTAESHASKHTPGPWTVLLRGVRGTFHIPEAQAHEVLASHTDGVDGYTVSKANANLIAAAPAMYAEMRRYLPLLERLEDSPVWHDLAAGLGIATINGYREALRKARGD